MKSQILLAALVLSVIPTLGSQARIVQPEVQFKTLEQIQTDALSKSETETLTEDQKRQQRLLRLTRSSNTGVNRVKSAKENFKRKISSRTNAQSVKTRGSLFSKKRSFRGSRERQAGNTYQASRTSVNRDSSAIRSDVATTIRARLRARLKAQKEASATTSTEAKDYAEFTPLPGQEWGR